MPGSPIANPSRLKSTADVLPLALKVSVLVKALWTRNTGSPASQVPSLLKSEHTTQPPCQALLLLQVAPSVVAQTITWWPSLMPSARANCMSPIRPLTSAEIRLAVVMYLNEGTPMTSRIPTMLITTTISIMVKPALRRRFRRVWDAVLMAPRVARQACASLTFAWLRTVWPRTAGCFTETGRLCRGRKADAHARSLALRGQADGEVRVVRPGDLIHDRQAQSAARSGRSRQPIEALAHAQPFRLCNARSVIVHLEKGITMVDATAHRDVAATRGVFERVVDQVAQQILQQPRIPGHLRGLRIGAQVQAGAHCPIDVALHQLLHQRA